MAIAARLRNSLTLCCLVSFICSVQAASSTCSNAAATQTAGLICNRKGIALKPALYGTYKTTGNKPSDCLNACLADSKCQSTAHNPTLKVCYRFKSPLSAQQFKSYTTVPITFWDRNCWTSVCSVIPDPPVPVPTTPSTTRQAITTTPRVIDPPEPENTQTGTDWTASYTYYEVQLPTVYSMTYSPFSQSPVEDPDLTPTSVPANLLAADYSYIVPKTRNLGKMTNDDFKALGAGKAQVWVPPTYRLVKPSKAPSGFYDLQHISTGRYVARSSTGALTLRDTSSNGQTPIKSGSVSYVTTIFTSTCDGKLVMASLSEKYAWQAIDGSSTAPVQSSASDSGISMLSIAVKNAAQQVSKKVKRVDYTGGAAPRCLKQPPGLQAVLKPGLGPGSSDGCGSGATGAFVPNLDFGSSCDAHDLCFDNCEAGTWEGCNNQFYDNMHSACVSKYPWTESPFSRSACEGAALLYKGSVSGSTGAGIFSANNAKRCKCTCGSGSYCGGQCRTDYSSDDFNCGACGKQCASDFACRNGNCECLADTQNDDNNCGVCRNRCPSKSHCSGGKCVCNEDTCGTTCLSLKSHARNCGTCGNVCASEICKNGQCWTPPPLACVPKNPIKYGSYFTDEDWSFTVATDWAVGGATANFQDGVLHMDFARSGTISLKQPITLCSNTKYTLTWKAKGANGSCSWLVGLVSNNGYYVADHDADYNKVLDYSFDFDTTGWSTSGPNNDQSAITLTIAWQCQFGVIDLSDALIYARL